MPPPPSGAIRWEDVPLTAPSCNGREMTQKTSHWGSSSTEKIELAIQGCFLHTLSTVGLVALFPVRIGSL